VTVLTVNSGSSSLKWALFTIEGDRAERLADGAAESIGLPSSRVWTRRAGGSSPAEERRPLADHAAAVTASLAALATLKLPPLRAVGHRLVHGGPEHTAPARVDRRVLESLRALTPFAPLHLPVELAGIEAVEQHFPGLPQVACFDTAFHRRMPESAQRFPLPRSLWDAGIRRYGFHGLSYEFIVGHLGARTLGRAIIAHLGNGSSMAAVRDGAPLDTTMGFTPAGGVMMGTRSGDLDPGVLLHLLAHRGYDAARLDHLVNHEAGLLGVSGTTPDMKTLLERRSQDPHAAQAVALFCYQLRKTIGALAAVLGGVDTLVFTGGIGERAAPVRAEAVEDLGHLSIRVDPERNTRHEPVISPPGAPCTVRVVPTQEDLVIARHTWRVVSGVTPARETPAPIP
jgi:acetate kinase